MSDAFAAVEGFCLFLGYPRSGSSILGALLDAHPNIVISHQLNVLALIRRYRNIERDALVAAILENSKRSAQAGRVQSGYSYRVNGAWQGTHSDIRIVGDKEAERTSQELCARPWLLRHLAGLMQVPVKIVHPVRNPFDIISTVVIRSRLPVRSWKFWGGRISLDEAIRRYVQVWTKAVLRTRAQMPRQDWLTVYQEDLVADPMPALRRLCEFLGQDVPEEYLSACMRIVWVRPHESRHDLRWTPAQKDRIVEIMEEVDFLSRYLPN